MVDGGGSRCGLEGGAGDDDGDGDEKTRWVGVGWAWIFHVLLVNYQLSLSKQSRRVFCWF